MNWLTVIVHWLHVLFAVTWFGGHIARVLLVEPAVRTLPAESQAVFNRYIEKYGTRIFVPAIVGVGITGILRGTVFGPVKSLDALLGTPYGLTFLAAIALGLLLALLREAVRIRTAEGGLSSVQRDLSARGHGGGPQEAMAHWWQDNARELPNAVHQGQPPEIRLLTSDREPGNSRLRVPY